MFSILSKYKETFGCTVADLNGIDPSSCMHMIHLEDAKPSRDMQRMLNPNMKEVVKKKIIKLLEVGIIYPISDSR